MVKIALCVKKEKMHKFIHACAGSGKTQFIADACFSNKESGKDIAVITFTVSGQDELRDRLHLVCEDWKIPKVFGWYQFLIQHIIRPYIPLLFPKQKVKGLYYPRGSHEDPYIDKMRYFPKEDPRRYFVSNDGIHREFIEELAVGVIEKSQGMVQNRLNKIFNLIMIDESQDIGRNGLKVIEYLLSNGSRPGSSAEYSMYIVGDARQSILSTSRSSNKNKKYSGYDVIKWYREMENQQLLEIESHNYTYRCVQEIASFSDKIFHPGLGFESTVSRCCLEDEHKGVFLVCKKDFQDYINAYNPVVLRHSKAVPCDPEWNPVNIGVSKGRTYERVAIMATDPIKKFIEKKEYFSAKSASSFYVAVTRAKVSVAIVVDKVPRNVCNELGIQIWSRRMGADVVVQDSLFKL